VFGSREPAHKLIQPLESSAGVEAIELARLCSLVLDPWQQDFLTAAMGRDAAGRWVADEAALVVPRQNGRSEVLLARLLWGLLLGGERTGLFTAHEHKTATESFLRLKSLVEHPDFVAKYGEVTRLQSSYGREQIEFSNGARALFIARSRKSGRGFSPDFIVLDEAFELSDLSMAALKPSLAARRSPQLWFSSSAPHETSSVLRRICLKGRAGEQDRLVFFEWCASDVVASDAVEGWLASNPAVGYRIRLDTIASELTSGAMDEESFRRERLGVWNEEVFTSVFDRAQWERLYRPDARTSGVAAIAVDVNPDRSRACIAAAVKLALPCWSKYSGRTGVWIGWWRRCLPWFGLTV